MLGYRFGELMVGRPIFFLAGMMLAFCAGMTAHAGDSARAPEANNLRQASLTHENSAFVELVAADFYETRLRLAQSRRIEAGTAEHYLSLSPAEREQFRQERRRIWREMSEKDRAALRGTKLPRFSNLDEAQKQIFRTIAMDELGAFTTAQSLATGDDI